MALFVAKLNANGVEESFERLQEMRKKLAKKRLKESEKFMLKSAFRRLKLRALVENREDIFRELIGLEKELKLR